MKYRIELLNALNGEYFHFEIDAAVGLDAAFREAFKAYPDATIATMIQCVKYNLLNW